MKRRPLLRCSSRPLALRRAISPAPSASRLPRMCSRMLPMCEAEYPWNMTAVSAARQQPAPYICQGSGVLWVTGVRYRAERRGTHVKFGAYLSLAAGLVLLGLCVSQWNDSTASTAGRALNSYQQGDRADLASLRRGTDLNDTMRIAIEAVAGITWLVIGGVLLKKSAGAKYGHPRDAGVRRR